MKRFPVLLAALPLLVLATAVHPTAPGAPGTLPYGKCVRLDSINEWRVVDARTVLLRTGPYRYRLTTRGECPRLGIGVPSLRLHPSESDKAVDDARLCGGLGETVSSAYQPPCAVASIELIDKATFEGLGRQALHHGSGADQPGARP